MKLSYKATLLILVSAFLGSCTTFHTPLSRELTTRRSAKPAVAATESKITSEDIQMDFKPKKITFDWPVDDARLTRGFLPNKRRPHLGLDLAAPRGTPILASKGGTIIYTGKEFRGFGKMVLIESGDGWATLYAHLDKILVSEGQVVHQGEVLGHMGRTGRATGVHLHFEIRKLRGPVDPLPLLPNGNKIAKLMAQN
ncbi:MAG: M23 family metallopeptidase [Bdellovibrionia bacterium]